MAPMSPHRVLVAMLRSVGHRVGLDDAVPSEPVPDFRFVGKE
jgi:hypothetical protein